MSRVCVKDHDTGLVHLSRDGWGGIHSYACESITLLTHPASPTIPKYEHPTCLECWAYLINLENHYALAD